MSANAIRDSYSDGRRDQIVALARRKSLATIFAYREHVEAGGLMSYGTCLADSYRQAGIYSGRILKGEKPTDLPVLQPTKFEMVINVKAAKSLGVQLPPGSRNSVKRSARQTEDARFWLAVDGRVYYPVIRTLAVRRKLSLLDSARLFALTAVARNDALIAVFDAKYHYNFWRPVTAIRNGDIDDNPVTERDPAWLPIDVTPPFPEYPCAHCIVSASLASVVEAAFSSADLPEVSIESPTLPGVVHHWTNVRDFCREIAEARIWAGFHFGFSTRVGQDMGLKTGQYVVHSILQPPAESAR